MRSGHHRMESLSLLSQIPRGNYVGSIHKVRVRPKYKYVKFLLQQNYVRKSRKVMWHIMAHRRTSDSIFLLLFCADVLYECSLVNRHCWH